MVPGCNTLHYTLVQEQVWVWGRRQERGWGLPQVRNILSSLGFYTRNPHIQDFAEVPLQPHKIALQKTTSKTAFSNILTLLQFLFANENVLLETLLSIVKYVGRYVPTKYCVKKAQHFDQCLS
eukprot:TRINITY_DN2839_c0_g1_i1.p3 TRINITY_DN2839_c0_g1~~TRINITY_DN2839_c0_g1_i1.p3  ORF type:complete len:123 (-),score=6.80 TRINITY_DN2839_c0_g1_i1:118-486(-)